MTPHENSAEITQTQPLTPEKALACLESALMMQRNAADVRRYLRLAGDDQLAAAWEVARAALGAVETLVKEKRAADKR